IHARLARGRTQIVGFDLAIGVAAIINGIGTDLLGRGHAVIALLARVENAISAILEGRQGCRAATGSTAGTGADTDKAAPTATVVGPSTTASTASPRRRRRRLTVVDRCAAAASFREQEARAGQDQRGAAGTETGVSRGF